jgi:hypothetical protein
VLLRRAEAGPVLAEIVGVGAVHDGVEAARAGDLAQPAPQLGLAEVAAVGGIGEIARVGELAGLDFEQRHVESDGELDRRAPLRFGVGCAAAHHREKPVRTERLAPDDGEQRGVDPTRVAQQHPPVAEQVTPEMIEVGHGQ